MTPEGIARALASDAIFDPQRQLRAEGRKELDRALATLRGRGLRGHVVIVPDGDPETLRAVWPALGADPRTDLLLIWTRGRWEARGWGLDDAVIARELDAAEPALAEYLGRGLTVAIERLGAAALGEAPPSEGASWLVLGGGGLAAAATLGALGWVLARRSRRAAEDRQLTDARRTAEHAIAGLLVDADELGRDDALELQHKATRLSEELRRATTDAEALEVRLGRVRQVESEVALLRSTLLQKTRGSS